MKKIIDGRLYNTDTARELATWDNGFPERDFPYIRETLYIKKNGEYFIHGAGGAKTRYAQRDGSDRWGGGSAIIPLSEAAARSWAEQHLPNAKYEAIFGPVAEGEEMTLTTVKLRVSTHERLRRAAYQQGVTQQQLVQALLDQHLPE